MSDEKEKIVQQVTTGGVKAKAPGFLQKLIALFVDLPEDKSLKEYLIQDVIVPGLKNMVVDTAISIFGGGSRPSNFGRNTNKVSVSYEHGRNERTNYSVKKDNGMYNIVSFTVPDKAQASKVIESARDLIDHTGDCSIRDYYKIVGYTASHDAMDTIYGWRDLSGAFSRRSGQEWEIVMPRPIKL